MSFQPVVGQGGYSGWRLLQRTGDLQRSLVAREPAVARDVAYVRERLGSTGTAEALVADYRLRNAALSAFGLEDDINNRFFIRKVLESDLSDPKSLANRLGDKRYLALAQAFGFGSGAGPDQQLADEVAERHVAAELERRVGTVDGNLRLAMNAQRELAKIGVSAASDNIRWYNILGSAPLRKVIEGGLGLTSDFTNFPVEKQLEQLKQRTAGLFGSGSPSVFAEPANLEKIIQRFLIRAETVSPAQSSYNAALLLLSNSAGRSATSLPGYRYG